MLFFKAITRKEDNAIIKKICKRQQEKKHSVSLNELKAYVNYGLLYKSLDNKWRIATKNNSQEIPVGNYAFVRTEIGFFRVVPAPSNGQATHLGLAEYAKAVRYAGEVTFKTDNSGEMVSWNNRSGGYKPKNNFFWQAGFPSHLFIAEHSIKENNKKLSLTLRCRLDSKYKALLLNPPSFISPKLLACA